ncbi:Histone methylation protein DOT1 [Phytophthora infestans]|uniref:Histone methylation protein DOT1 n=1 Tax=Phytophthora infestans TaxID=4787 RepID=A0A8S9TTF3_PHYIN|nr:Histone methylation protein DOT1 [Phytophthora infestans]
MRTTFSDNEDKRLVMLALEFEILGSRVVWDDISRKMPGRRAPKPLEMRLRTLKRTYGKQPARFPPCFLSTHRPHSNAARIRLLVPTEAERAVRDISSDVSAADVRQQAGKPEKNAEELLPATVSRIIRAAGPVNSGDIFLDVGAGVGNVAAQFALQTLARQCLDIEKRVEIVRRASECLRSHASRLILLHKVQVLHGDVWTLPFLRVHRFKKPRSFTKQIFVRRDREGCGIGAAQRYEKSSADYFYIAVLPPPSRVLPKHVVFELGALGDLERVG